MQTGMGSTRCVSAPTAMRQNEVPAQLGALDAELLRLEKSFDDLRGRIIPILAERPHAETDIPDCSPCDSSLARTIQNFAMRLENLNIQVSSMLGRIEL